MIVRMVTVANISLYPSIQRKKIVRKKKRKNNEGREIMLISTYKNTVLYLGYSMVRARNIMGYDDTTD